ncbi:MAG: response regulator [Candidatus Sericytochromatia bacterium]
MENKKKNINILIADDESLIRMDIKEILMENNYEVIGEAKNGKEVLEICKEKTPELLILDIQMPEMNGLEALEQLNNSDEYPKFPVIMLTAYPKPELIEKAVALGVFAYLIKPVKEGELLANIEIAIARNTEMKIIQKEVGVLKETIEVRKLVEKAKGILMNKYLLTEQEAFKKIQKYSMDNRTSMKNIAEKIINNGDLDI